MKFTIESKFHPTRVTINAKVNETLSANQVKKIDKTLCGMQACSCGGIFWSKIDDNYSLVHQNNSYGNTEFFIVKN